MASDWFKLESKGTGRENSPYRPNLHGYNVKGHSGNFSDQTKNAPWLVRVFADETTLDALEASLTSSERRFGSVPTTSLNDMMGQDRDASDWNSVFRVSE